MKMHNLLNTKTAKALQKKASLALHLKMKLATLSIITIGACAGSVGLYNNAEQLQQNVAFLPIHHLATISQPRPEVLGESTTSLPSATQNNTQSLNTPSLTDLINAQIEKYIASGKLQINQVTSANNNGAETGLVQNNNSQTTAVIGGSAIVGYYPGNSSNGFYGASVAGFTQLSGQSVSAGSANITNVSATNLTVNGTAINTAALWNSVGSNIYYNTGNIGIGTSTVAEKLVVQGNILTLGGDAPVLVNSTSTSGISSNLPGIIHIYGNYAYVAFGGASTGNLAIYSISNPTSPVLLGSTTTPSSAFEVLVSGNYAYVPSRSASKIYVYDISNPSSMVLVSTITTSGGPFTAAISGKYLVDATQGCGPIEMYDISNPASPFKTSSVSSGLCFPRGLSVAGKYAYLTGHNGGNTGVINIFDISNPNNISSVSSTTFILSDSHARLYSNYISGNYAYISSYNSFNGSGQLSIFDISNPSNVFILGTTTVNAGSSQRVIVSGNYAYMVNGADGGDRSISVYDVSDPRNIVAKGVSATISGPGFYDMAISGKYAYVADSASGGAIKIYELNSLETPTILTGDIRASGANFVDSVNIGNKLNIQGGLTVGPQGASIGGGLAVQGTGYFSGNVGIGTSSPSQALQVVGSISNVLTTSQTLKNVATVNLGGSGTIGVAVSGRYLYTTNLNNLTFSVVDVSVPTSPVLMATTTIPGNSYGMYVAGSYAYVGTGNGLVVVYDVSNPKKPTKISQLSVGDRIQMVQVSGRYLYGVGLFSSKLYVVDISNPYAPVNVGSSVGLGWNANYLYVSGHYAYITNGTANLLHVIDVANPTAPALVATISLTDSDAIYVSGRYAYTTSANNAVFSVIDVSNPLAPVIVSTTSVGGSYAGLVVSGRYAYVTDMNNNKVSVIDVSNPSAPVILQTVAVGSSPGAMALNGNYLYVANGDGTASVIDISGTETNSLTSASADIGNLQVRNDILANGQLQVYGGMQVAQGAQFNGPVGINVSTTTSTSVFNITTPTSSIMTVLGNGYIGIGTSTPKSPLSIVNSYADDYNPIGAISVSSNSFSNVYLNSYSAINWVSPIFRGYRAEGTMASATAVTTGDALARFSGEGYDGSNWQEAALIVMGVGNRTSGMPGYMAFFTTPDGSNSVTQRMILDQNGNLGIGTTAPGSMLAVTGTSGSTTPLFIVSSSTNAVTLIVTANGRVGIGSTTPGHLISLSGGAYSDGASWTNASDRNLKENFATITPIDALQKIDGLDIQQWNYKMENASTTHIGPTAQDFYAAFHLGGDAGNTSISSIDPAGVALLGIQALDQKITALQGSLTGNATTSSLAVYNPVNFSGDSVGEAKILAGASSVRVNFTSSYTYQPIVTITSEDRFAEGYIADKDSSGFTIALTVPTNTDVTFDWHSFASPGAKLVVSSAFIQNIQLVVPQPPAPVVTPPIDPVTPVDNSTSTPNLAPMPTPSSSSTTTPAVPPAPNPAPPTDPAPQDASSTTP